MSYADDYSLNPPICDQVKKRSPFLVELSRKDQKWDDYRRKTDAYADLYSGTEYSKYADRMKECARRLSMIQVVDPITGEIDLHLDSTWCCRVRNCPTCVWRNSLKWEAKVFRVMPRVMECYPDARYLFLTLTLRNCPLIELRETITLMNSAWQRMSQRKRFPAIGWIRKVEVTRSQNDYAHPHLHCLLMVRPSYYTGKYYLTKDEWIELWQQSLGVDYEPSIKVQRADGTKTGEIDKRSVLETLKYSVKPEDILKPDINHPTKNSDWLVGLTRQLHKMRMFSTSGVFKEYLRDLEDENQDLVHINEDALDTEDGLKAGKLIFNWSQHIKHYIQEVW